MNSYHRVLASISHIEPDRIPFDLGGTPMTGIHKNAYFQLKNYLHIKIFFHSCGSIRKVLGDLIEAGIDIINPVQKSAAGMDLLELKKLFGKDVVFWGGGVDTQYILNNGSVNQVADDVRRSLDVLAPSGGFVFAAVHNIQANVPPENILAMWKTVRDFSGSKGSTL